MNMFMNSDSDFPQTRANAKEHDLFLCFLFLFLLLGACWSRTSSEFSAHLSRITILDITVKKCSNRFRKHGILPIESRRVIPIMTFESRWIFAVHWGPILENAPCGTSH